MAADIAGIRQRLRAFDFDRLFVEDLGWDRYRVAYAFPVDGETYDVRAVAEKRGVQVFVCPAPDGALPERSTRKKIDNQLAKQALEHLLIFTDAAQNEQRWLWALRQPEKPVEFYEERYSRGDSGQRLAEKLQALFFSIEDEERLTLVDVNRRVAQGLRKERVTRRFYDLFKTEREHFLGFVEGIADEGDRAWYASLMLNRLMFAYFVQKKGFLDGDDDYLRHKLEAVRQTVGQDQFHTFYRRFLLKLFHEGLATKPPRAPEIERLLGNVPYLNGGIFEPHMLEQDNPALEIPDAAFERIFDFFDQYTWHLDDRPLKSDKEINPDVLGYIFEKYINQKEMGAYYTKEDITEYISKNTVIPFLFDAAKKAVPIAFEPGAYSWRLLQDDPNRYIHEAVRRGTEGNWPSEAVAGLTDVSQRGGWNRPAPQELALPTETWREYVARRKRYEEIWLKLLDGQVTSIDDLITYNLDVRQFAQDVIASAEGPEIVRAFYNALREVSVLDPTCGSGAFLFAALNILQPLYDACLDRMRTFVEELDRSDEPRPSRKFEDFRRVLDDVARHPNEDYYVLKRIIIDNLYGVDIMPEAVEICKLRLFLKLMAQVEAGQPIEALPDIDFNIRAGNTLVGFATLDEIRRAIELDPVTKIRRLPSAKDDEALARIEESAEIVDRAFKRFHEQQTTFGGAVTFADKQELRRRLRLLSDQLDRYQARLYGMAPEDAEGALDPTAVERRFDTWRESHKPFHWYAEFYGIMKRRGFDVIIGNPPWIEYSKVKREYEVRDYITILCGNLHGICTERALQLRSPGGSSSFIVQLPLTNSTRMHTVRNQLRCRSDFLTVATFDDRPGKLFEGLQHCRSSVFVSRRSPNGGPSNLLTTRYQRWPTEARPNLFSQFEYAKLLGDPIYDGHFPKYANSGEESLFRKIKDGGTQPLARITRPGRTSHFIFYQEATQYWVKATVGLPYYAKNGIEGAPAHGRYLYFDDTDAVHATSAILNSSLFYAYFIAYGDCFHLTDTLVSGFPTAPGLLTDDSLVGLGEELMVDLRANAEVTTINTKDGNQITYAEFYASKSKPIIDEIDRVLARHYGFTDEELDFIINYDIKYRMGRAAGEDE